jgi:hypothetical protein
MRPTLLRSRRPLRAICLALYLVLLATVLGCGARTGTISGQVLYNNKSVPGGLVTFHPTAAGHNAVTAMLDEQGHYEATVPAGEVKITVDNREFEPPSAPAPPPDIPGFKPPPGVKIGPPPKEGSHKKDTHRFVRIPEKYYKVETTDLQYKVESGPQPHNIELK